VRTTTIIVTHDLQEAIKLGDRIAVLSDHAQLQQYATPSELLARPGNDFVERFVGEDRGIMRLSVTPIPADGLRPVAEAGDDAPVVAAGASLREAFGAMLAAGKGAVVVRDGDTPIGALTAADVQVALSAAAVAS
jgi:osmoprotectant transport system ATP-binding protein